MKQSDVPPQGIHFKPRKGSDASAVRLTPENSAAVKVLAGRENTTVTEVVNQLLPLGIVEYQRRNGGQLPPAGAPAKS